MILTSSLTHAENWQAYVDKNINVDITDSIVNQYEPIIRCDKNTTPDAQVCYSTPIKVLIVDASSGSLAGYEIGHNNQNNPIDMLQKYVTSIEVPSAVASLMTNTLDAYEILNDTAEAISSNKLTAASSSTGNCDSNSPTAKAVRAIYDSRTTGNVQIQAQGEFNQRFSNLTTGFALETLQDFSFNVSSNGVSIAGTLQFYATSKSTITRFASTNDDYTGNEVAAYNLTVKNNAIHLTVDEWQTILDGIPLKILKSAALTAVSDCLIKELNNYIPASVTSYYSDNVDAISLPVGWKRVPMTLGAGKLKSNQCVWSFHAKEQQYLQVLGSCPESH